MNLTWDISYERSRGQLETNVGRECRRFCHKMFHVWENLSGWWFMKNVTWILEENNAKNIHNIGCGGFFNGWGLCSVPGFL
jgi:hypothetical protein